MTQQPDATAPSRRVLAWPRERSRNIYTHDLYRHLESTGDGSASVGEYRVGRGWRQRSDIVHMHWPEIACDPTPTWKAAGKAGVVVVDLLACRLRGARIVWTQHDSGSHEQIHPRLERWYTRALRELTSGVIHLSQAAADQDARDPSMPTRVIPLGPPSTPADLPDADEARRRLDLPDGVLLATVGRLQRYKQIPALIDEFLRSDRSDAHLLVAGEVPDPREADAIERAALGSDRVIFRPGWLEEADFHLCLRAADVVVLGYADHLNSGVALFSLGAGTPVAVSDSPAIRELRSRFGAAWVRIVPTPVDPDVLEDVVTWSTSDQTRPPIELVSWAEIANATMAFYEEIIAGTA
jgi:beta-1,4-mannosyltransferase